MPENHLYFRDNLDVLRCYVKDESVDLIYLDPPFNSRQDYNVLFARRSRRHLQARSPRQIRIGQREPAPGMILCGTRAPRVQAELAQRATKCSPRREPWESCELITKPASAGGRIFFSPAIVLLPSLAGPGIFVPPPPWPPIGAATITKSPASYK